MGLAAINSLYYPLRRVLLSLSWWPGLNRKSGRVTHALRYIPQLRDGMLRHRVEYAATDVIVVDNFFLAFEEACDIQTSPFDHSCNHLLNALFSRLFWSFLRNLAVQLNGKHNFRQGMEHLGLRLPPFNPA